MVNPLLTNINHSILFLLLLITNIAAAQSCVCYQKDLLNDYKDTDFIGTVTVISKEQHPENPDVDIIKISTQEIFKGTALEEVYVFQKKGFGKDNNMCRLYLKPGDQLVLYANKKPGYYFTMPCYRNRMMNNTEPAYQITLQNHIKILRQLMPFTEKISSTASRCDKIMTDGVTLSTIENIPLNSEKASMGLYTVKFDEDQKIRRIDVVSSFNKEVDNKVRIALIKKIWQICDLNENGELLLGYFYNPETLYRRSHLSPL